MPRRLDRLLPWVPALACLAAHGPALTACLLGDRVLGGPLGHRDTLYAHRFAFDTWARAQAAWAADPVGFFTAGVWQAAAESHALNLLDFALLVWPARAMLPVGAAFLAIHLGLLLLGPLSGAVFARALGFGPAGQCAAALVVGASAPLRIHVDTGQYPQALLAAPLLALVGAARAWRGERGGAVALAAGVAVCALLWWQWAVVLGVGLLTLWAGALAGGWPRGGNAAQDTGLALIFAAGVVAPAAAPVVEALRAGAAMTEVVPWGTAYVAGSAYGAHHLVDEVPLGFLVDPAEGWLPPLPLLLLLPLGATRGQAPWIALAAVGAALILGPEPELPGIGRVDNPIYQLVYQWVPTAARMRHPLRYGVLWVAGLAALAAAGADRAWSARARVTAAILALAAVAAVVPGPWPLRTSPLPTPLVEHLAGCDAVWAPHADGCTAAAVEGLLGRATTPTPECPLRNVPLPDPARRAADRARVAAWSAARDEGVLPPGVCALVDVTRGVPNAWAAMGAPEVVDVAAGALTDEAGAYAVWGAPTGRNR